jgi:hypothetical protein
MKKRHAGRLFGAATGIAAVSGVMLLCIIAWGLTSCSGDDDLKEGNQITSFELKIKDEDARVFIKEVEKTIDVYVPAGTNVTKLTPVVKISSGASVVPLEEDEVDFTHPMPYTVTAENGVSQTYTVTVTAYTADVVLESIEIRTLPTKTVYEIGESVDVSGLVVVGLYSDGSVQRETGYALNPSPVPTDAAGDVEVTVAVGGETTTFTITVRDSPQQEFAVTIGWPTDEVPELFGIPAGGITLSATQSNNLPDKIVISAAGKTDDKNPPSENPTVIGIYSNIKWYVDGVSLSSDDDKNILLIEAKSYTLKKHNLTFVGTLDGVEYSRTIPFTVAQ